MTPYPLSHWLTDPLAGLDAAAHSRDGAAWEEAFRVKYPASGRDPDGLYGVMRGLRCLGVALRPNRAGGYRLAPPPDMDHEELEALAGRHLAGCLELAGRLAVPA